MSNACLRSPRNTAILSIGIGVAVGVIAGCVGDVNFNPFFQTLAITQASVLSIAIAIIILSMQVTSDRYTPSALFVFRNNRVLSGVLLLFGVSILYDILFLLINTALTTTIRIIISSGIGALLATGSFLSLFYVYDEVLDLLTPERLSQAIEESISLHQFQQYIENRGEDDRTPRNPFQNPISAASVAIRQTDKRSALQLTDSISNTFSSIFEEHLTGTEALTAKDQDAHLSVLREIRDLGEEAIENNLPRVLNIVLTRLQETGRTAMEHSMDEFAGRIITMFVNLSTEGHQADAFVQESWQPFEDLIATAITHESEEGVIASVEGANELLTELLEDASLIPSRETHIAEQLIGYLFNGWSNYIDLRGSELQSDQFYKMISYLDLHMDDEELSNQDRYLVIYLIFEDVNKSLVDSYVFDRANSGVPIPQLSITLIEGLASTLRTAVDINHRYLSKRIAKILIELVVGLAHDRTFSTHALNKLREIARTSDCGRYAVTEALSELQQPITDPLESPRLLSLAATGFESQEDFIDRVTDLEDEIDRAMDD
jgi:hypothetical protein